jgi:hypothetical protein
MFVLIWSAIGLGLLLALLIAAVRDRRNRRHGRRDRTGSEIWLDVREQRRDSRANSAMGPMDPGQSWTSWSRRNR